MSTKSVLTDVLTNWLEKMPYVECVDCGEEFYREYGETWKVRCIPCWRRNKQRKDDAANELLETLLDLKAENMRMKESIEELEENLRFLIFAAHPDRNPGKEDQAHRATRFLLDMRSRLLN